tara:strand:- start:103 stop:486 length:384 start_codon:yes stop_codon:yes gene_type:complete
VTKFLKSIFCISVLFLIILSLYPGSLIGYFVYGNLYQQPNLIANPFGTAINHFISYIYISLLGFLIYLRSKNFQKLFYGLIFLSMILEVLQSVIPIRTFQLGDLIANLLGVLVAYFLVKIYLYFNKS